MEKIFKWLTAEAGIPETPSYVYWVAKEFSPDDMVGIDKLLLCFLAYCSKLTVTPRKSFLEAYLRVDGKKDIKKYNIKTDTMSIYDYNETSQLEEAYNILIQVATDTYDRYLEQDLSDRDFKVDMHEFMSKRKSEAIMEAMLKSYPHLNDGSDINDVSQLLKTQLQKIDELYDVEKLKDIGYRSESEEGDLHFLAPTGMPCIDGDIGGIYTRLIYTLTSQPKGGKTRFTLAHFIYPILVFAKKSVVMWETELSRKQVENILIAYHIVQVYGGRFKIPDSIMLKPDEMTPEQKQLYESARIDLFESGKYGKFYFKHGCIVEDLEDEATMFLKSDSNIGMVCIDYMGFCDSKPKDKFARPMQEYEIITMAYKVVKRLLYKWDIAAVCVNQFNDKGCDAACAGRPIHSGMIQGGHIVTRVTDYDITMTYTEEQKITKKRTLSAGSVRGANGFEGVLIDTDLSVSVFRQEVA